MLEALVCWKPTHVCVLLKLKYKAEESSKTPFLQLNDQKGVKQNPKRQKALMLLKIVRV